MRLLSAQYFSPLYLKFQKQKNVGYSSKSLQVKFQNPQIHSNFKYFNRTVLLTPLLAIFVIIEHNFGTFLKDL